MAKPRCDVNGQLGVSGGANSLSAMEDAFHAHGVLKASSIAMAGPFAGLHLELG